MSSSAKLDFNGKILDLPIFEGSEGEKALDIGNLRAETGLVTLDNGFVNTGACKSAITFLNGEEGILRYRGYPIEELCEKSNFLEVSHLLYNGELPTREEYLDFEKSVAQFSNIPEAVKKIIDQFPGNSHPMGVISAASASLSAFYPDFIESEVSEEQKRRILPQLLGQCKIIAAYFYRRTMGLDPVDSRPKDGYAFDFLNMMFNRPGVGIKKEVAQALDLLLILHADHEQNCSASTVRVVGSSKANVFACISAGINALWGQLHGGANQAVLEMLKEIEKAGGDYKKALARAKDKNDPFRLMGLGHRVYKNFDPRAKIIKKACDTVLSTLGVKDPLLDIAKGLEEEALKDSYFIERKLYPNVDFYSGIIYRALGIPTNMFTVMFVLGRLPGWLAQWKEMRDSPETRIARPRQIYVGPKHRSLL